MAPEVVGHSVVPDPGDVYSLDRPKVRNGGKVWRGAGFSSAHRLRRGGLRAPGWAGGAGRGKGDLRGQGGWSSPAHVPGLRPLTSPDKNQKLKQGRDSRCEVRDDSQLGGTVVAEKWHQRGRCESRAGEAGR